MHPYAKQYKGMSAYEIGFIEGAVWADEHPQWISVEDKLPPMHCHLQDLGESTYGRGKIFCDSEPVITHRVDGCIDMHCLMFNGEKNEFVWGGWNGSHSQPFDGSMITHWMMPAPPSGSSEKPNNSKEGGNQ
jgi:hypothetical protein